MTLTYNGGVGNPFDYQRPLDPTQLIDRHDELDALQRAAADRVAIRLASPRRFGKTSLLQAHLATMRAAGHRACLIDFDRVATIADAADRIVDGLRQLPEDPTGRLEGRLSRLGVSLGTNGLSVQVGPRSTRSPLDADQARAVVRDLLALPAELSTDGDLVVVAMDEFQDLLTADTQLDGLIRSVIQHHGDRVAYVFAGSSPSLMRELFSDRERPFYGQARPLDLPPLPADETVEHLLRSMPSTDPRAVSATVQVVRVAAGHPQRTMLLAHHLYDLLDAPATDADPATEALRRALAEVDDVCRAVWNGLDRSARSVIVALADGQSPFSPQTASDHSTARSTLQSATERLAHDGQLVVRDAAGVRLLDPLLAEWLRRR